MTQNTSELEWLRQMYLDDLSKIVNYGGNDRPRVRNPGKWQKLPAVINFAEGINEPLDLLSIEDDRKIYCWSDTHFWHKNIIAYSERPHDSVEQMNEFMIANYNEYVGENDICIWGGDVGFKGTTIINEMLDTLNGYKILIVGNHDFKKKNLRQLTFDETYLIYTIKHPDVNLVFTHYPMENIRLPWVNIHGHLHLLPNPQTGNPLHININCEVQDYKPRLLSEIITQAKSRILEVEG